MTHWSSEDISFAGKAYNEAEIYYIAGFENLDFRFRVAGELLPCKQI